MHITHWTWGPAKARGLLGPGHSHRGTLPESSWPTQSRQEKVLWEGKHHYHILLSWTPDSEKWLPKQRELGEDGSSIFTTSEHQLLAFCLLIWGFEAVSFLSGEADTFSQQKHFMGKLLPKHSTKEQHQESSGAAGATNSVRTTPLEQAFLLLPCF